MTAREAIPPILIVALFGARAGDVGADDGLDAHGTPLATTDGDPRDPLLLWRAEPQVARSLAITGLLELSKTPLIQTTVFSDGTLTREAALDTLLGLNLGIAFSPLERVQIVTAMPLWAVAEGTVAQGAALGDLRLTTPVHLWSSPSDMVNASLVPHLTLPTGDATRYLGEEGISGGGVLAAGLGGDAWGLTLNGGLDANPVVQLETLQSGNQLLTGAAVSFQPIDQLALHLEGVYTPTLTAAESALTEVSGTSTRALCPDLYARTTGECVSVEQARAQAAHPAELLLSVRGRTFGGLTWTLGGGTALTSAAGLPTWRGVMGIGTVIGKQLESSLDKSRGIPEISFEIEDLDCAIPRTGALTAQPETSTYWSSYTYTWLDEDGEVVATGSEIDGLPPGSYSLQLEYTSSLTSNTYSTTLAPVEVATRVRWEQLADAAVLADGYSLEKTGADTAWDAWGRSRNLLPEGESGWAEFTLSGAAPEGLRFGLLSDASTATETPEQGWELRTVFLTDESMEEDSPDLISTSAVALRVIPIEGSQDGAGSFDVVGDGEVLRVERTFDDPDTARFRLYIDGVETHTSAPLTVGDPMRVLAALRDPSALIERPRVSFGCPVPIRYATLQHRLDGSYYQTYDQQLYFRYEERYRAGAMRFRVTDRSHQVVAEGSITRDPGMNWLVLDFADGVARNEAHTGDETVFSTSQTLTTDGWYVLEVEDDKGQTQRARFIYH